MKKPVIRKLRCAVYTRKSSEEGLEQEFNSLDAQREACESYIASQKPEGWVLVPDHYDVVGFPARHWSARHSSICLPTSKHSGSMWSWSIRSIDSAERSWISRSWSRCLIGIMSRS
jgi:hypothetical protein